MRHNALGRLSITALAVVCAGALAWPALDAAPTVTGQARAVQASSALGTSTLADTGTLGSTSDAREASLGVGRVTSVVSGEALRAATIGWPDQVVSEASLTNLTLKLGLTAVSAGVVLAKVQAVQNAPAQATSTVGELTVNGIPIEVTGQPNQTIAIPGGRIVLNEQITSLGNTTVNALHATVFGVADVVIASATAGIR